MEASRRQMIGEIIDFVSAHPESTASLAVARRVLGERGERRQDANADFVTELRSRLAATALEDIEACYYLIK